MSELGQGRRFGSQPGISGLPPSADVLCVRRHVSKVPGTEVTASFDHLVGAGEQRRWHSQAECLGGLEIYHQFKLCGLLNRQVGWPLTLENSSSINSKRVISICETPSITHQATHHGEASLKGNCRNNVAHGQCRNSPPSAFEEAVSADQKCTDVLLDHFCEGGIKIGIALGVQHLKLQPKWAGRLMQIFRLKFSVRI